jgi:hypothetical protein
MVNQAQNFGTPAPDGPTEEALAMAAELPDSLKEALKKVLLPFVLPEITHPHTCQPTPPPTVLRGEAYLVTLCHRTGYPDD